MSWRDVLDVDRRHALRNHTWWWWWLLFFFRNDADVARTKQMVLLWGTRNCRRLVINGHRWRNDGGIAAAADGLRFDGVSAGWYYDGTRMHEPLFVDDGRLATSWTGDGGALRYEGGGTSVLEVGEGLRRVRVDRRESRVDLAFAPWTEHLSALEPTGKTYLRHLGYTMHKVRGSRVRGTVDLGQGAEAVEGTAYFQKVRINSPTSPWYWGVFHAANGSFLDYFLPHLGPPVLRRTARHRSLWDWGVLPLSRSFQFLDGSDGRLHRIRRVRVEHRYVDDLPVFRLRGEAAGQAVDLVMEAYARTYWKVEQPILGPLRWLLYYNEYPANVTRFRLRDGGKVVTLEDTGPIVGNCEHAWGLV